MLHPHATQGRPVPPLRAVRIAQGKGLREVASRTQIDPAQLSRVERGMGSLSVEALGRLARELDLKELTRLLAPYTGGDFRR